MSLPSNGITADVIRDIMPPYQLSADLLDAAFRSLPPPPADASATWRHTRITRLIGEITALKPADAGQARTAAQVLSLRELADTILNRAYVPEVTLPQLCRLGRAAAELVRTASGLVRGLERTQQKPVPFYGTVVQDEVDIAALDGIWCGRTPVPGAAGSVQRQGPLGGPGDGGATGPGPAVTDSANDDGATATDGRAGCSPARTAADSGDSPAVMHAEMGDRPDVTNQDGNGALAVRQPAPAHAEPPLGSVVTRLNQGPGWTLDVVRRRAPEEACAGMAPGAGAASAEASPAADGPALC